MQKQGDEKTLQQPLELPEKPPDPPRDVYNINYIAFFFLGLVHLLPYSYFTTATGYWMFKYRNTTINDTNAEHRTTLQAQFFAATGITLESTEIVFLVLSIFFAARFRVKTRLIFVLSVFLVLMAATASFVTVNTDSWQNQFFALTMTIIAIISATNGIFSITMYSLISYFPDGFLAPYLNGASLAGIFSATLQILSLTFGLSVKTDALAYFSFGILIVVGTLLVFFSTSHWNAFYLHYTKYPCNKNKEERKLTVRKFAGLVKKIWTSLVIGAIFLLSANIPPISLVVSKDEGKGPWNDIYFVPTITFLLRGCCELLGKILSFKVKLNLNSYTWILLSLARLVILVPLLMLCNAQPRHHLPVVFTEDYQYIIMIIVTGFSGGYFSNIMMINIGKFVNEEELEDAYHVFMVCFGVIMAALSFVGIISVNLL